MDGCNLLQTQASFKKREQRDNSLHYSLSLPGVAARPTNASWSLTLSSLSSVENAHHN